MIKKKLEINLKRYSRSSYYIHRPPLWLGIDTSKSLMALKISERLIGAQVMEEKKRNCWACKIIYV